MTFRAHDREDFVRWCAAQADVRTWATDVDAGGWSVLAVGDEGERARLDGLATWEEADQIAREVGER